jgi:general secretion pathway protein H
MKSTLRSRSPRTVGFTLVEMLVVVAIMGLGLAVFLGINYHQRESFRWRGSLREVRMFLQLARSYAILERRPDGCFYRLDPPTFRESLRGRRLKLPEGVGFRLSETQRERLAALQNPDRETTASHSAGESPSELRLVTFYGDGGAAGGPLYLQSGKRRARFEIDPLVGEIKVIEETGEDAETAAQ